MQLIRTIVATIDRDAKVELGSEVSFRKNARGLRVSCEGAEFGSIDPRWESFLRSEKHKSAKVASIDDGKASIAVYAPERGKVVGNDGSIELCEGELVFTPTDGRGQDRRCVAGVTASVESGEDLSERITATRLFLWGAYALAFKKKSGGQRYLVVEGDGFAWVIEVEGEAINEAVRFAALVNQAGGRTNKSSDRASGGGEAGLASELERVAALYQGGLLTEEEFAAAKRKLLGL